jgi:nitrogen regulatory protein PII
MKTVGSYIILFQFFTATFFSCTKSTNGNRTYHPIEHYIENLVGFSDLLEGRKVVIVVNTNGCNTCLDWVKEFALTVTNPDVKFIYSIEIKRLLDLEVVDASRKDTIRYFMDYDHIPFRKGMVSENPIVYYLSNGHMVDSVQLNPIVFDETIKAIVDFISSPH